MGIFYEKCIACGACKRICKSPDKCIDCFSCAEVCPENARRVWGEKYTVDELIKIILADKVYYDLSGGGVTFSGGECMLYPDFLAEILKKCRDAGVSVAIDTAGYVPYSSYEQVSPYVDLYLYDIKALDPQLHKKGTGVDNYRILENLDRLLSDGKRVIVRTPVIPEFNEGEECEKIVGFCQKRGLTVELLPYHEFGIDKRKALKK